MARAQQLTGDRRASGAAPVVDYGDEAVLRAADHVAAIGARRVLLVCGTTSFEASGAARMLTGLQRAATVRRWSDFTANVDSADLRAGLAALREFAPDVIVGVGGGSAMDMAKLLCTFGDVPDPHVESAIESGRTPDGATPRLVLVPTTSGSGAEATHFAVAYIGDTKYSVVAEAMRPDVIVLDPSLSISSSAYQRATSGIDALAQAIESRWAVGATTRSRLFARIALRLLPPAIERFVNAPDSASARAMCLGSHFAGRAIDISRTTAAHALSYRITKTYGASHGHAVALTLGGFIHWHAEAAPQQLRDGVDPGSHAAAMADVFAALQADGGRDAKNKFVALMRRIGLDPRLSAAGVTGADDRRALATAVNVERLGNNPVAMSSGEMTDFLDAIDDAIDEECGNGR